MDDRHVLKSGELQHLCNCIEGASAPTLIDLSAQTFKGAVTGLKTSLQKHQLATYDKSLEINVPSITISNGNIHLGLGCSLVIAAADVTLSNVTIRGGGPEWHRRNNVALFHIKEGADILLDNVVIVCDSKKPIHTMLVEGGASVRMKQCEVQTSAQALGCKINGAHVAAHETRFIGRQEVLLVTQPPKTLTNSSLRLQHCEVNGCSTSATCVAVIGSSCKLEASNTLMDNSLVGLLASKGAKAQLNSCTFSTHPYAGIWCSGGNLSMDGCTVKNCKVGLSVTHKGQAQAHGCKFECHQGTTALVQGNAALLRSTDCNYLSEPIQEDGGVILREDGIAAAFEPIKHLV